MSQEQPFKPTIPHAELKRKAMQAFFFDEDDLPSNREGRLSDRQKQRFVTTTKVGTIAFILSGLILSAVFIWTWEEPLDQLPWIIPALITVSFTIIGIYVYGLGGKVYKSGIVKSAIGTAVFEKRLGEMFLQIDGVYFRSQRKFRQIFVSDVQYKIYYAPSDNTIVSVEILD
jgi:hypothetical protein